MDGETLLRCGVKLVLEIRQTALVSDTSDKSIFASTPAAVRRSGAAQQTRTGGDYKEGQSKHCFHKLVEHVDMLKVAAQRKGQRREPAADDVRFVSERNGWLPFAGPILLARQTWQLASSTIKAIMGFSTFQSTEWNILHRLLIGTVDIQREYADTAPMLRRICCVTQA